MSVRKLIQVVYPVQILTLSNRIPVIDGAIKMKRFSELNLKFIASIFVLIACLLPLQIQAEKFPDVFELTDEFVIQETSQNVISNVNDLDVDSRGDIWIVDWPQGLVFKLDIKKKNLKLIAKKGRGPGENDWAESIFISPQGRVYVSSFMKQISIYDIDGKPIDSFLSSDGHMPTSDIVINSEGTIILGGPKYRVVGKTKTKIADMIHLYTEKGDYGKSFCKILNILQKLNLTNYRSIHFALDKDDNIYSVQPIDYRVTVFDKQGKLLKTFGHKNKHYLEPHHLPMAVKLDNEKLREFTKTITLFADVFVYGQKVLVLSQIYVGSDSQRNRYFIDIYDKDSGKVLYSGLETDARLCRYKNGKFYFVKTEIIDGEDERKTIRIFKMK